MDVGFVLNVLEIKKHVCLWFKDSFFTMVLWRLFQTMFEACIAAGALELGIADVLHLQKQDYSFTD